MYNAPSKASLKDTFAPQAQSIFNELTLENYYRNICLRGPSRELIFDVDDETPKGKRSYVKITLGYVKCVIILVDFQAKRFTRCPSRMAKN